MNEPRELDPQLDAARADIYASVMVINVALQTGNNSLVVEYVLKLVGQLLPAFQAYDAEVERLTTRVQVAEEQAQYYKTYAAGLEAALQLWHERYDGSQATHAVNDGDGV